jgi:hypothetical protein
MTAAQVCHAAGETSPGCLPSGTIAVVLGVSKDELQNISARLRKAKIPHKPIVENDPPYTDQWMAIGIQPRPKAEIYPHLSNLPLLRGSAPRSAKQGVPKQTSHGLFTRFRLWLNRQCMDV